MARMQNGGSGPYMSSSAFLPCVEMKCSAQDSVEFEQVISSLDAGYTFEDSQDVIEPLRYKDVFLIDEEGNTVIKIPAHLHPMCSWVQEPRRSWQGLPEKASRQMTTNRMCAPTAVHL